MKPVVCCALLLGFASGYALADSLPWEVWQSPDVLARLDARDQVLERSSHCLDGCRYDRSGIGVEDPADNPWPLRWLYRDGDEAVLFDEPGPGAVTRLWLTTPNCINPAMRVRFYLDGASVPALDTPLASLFDGSTPPFTAPMVGDLDATSGAYVSNVPISYQHALRITLTHAEDTDNTCHPLGRSSLWFQIQHHRLPGDMAVTSFGSGADEPGWRAFLGHAGDDPWSGMLLPDSRNDVLAADSTLTLATRSETAWLRGIRLKLPRDGYPHVRLQVDIDSARTIDATLADFFVQPDVAQIPTRSVLVGEDADGWLYAWWPMPFAQTLTVRLHADGTLAAPVTIASDLFVDLAAVPATAARLYADVIDTCADTGDATLFFQRGAGKLVGIAAIYRSPTGNTTILEGDERAYVDGSPTPAWYGTGVEDFYDGGFFFDGGPNSRALSGVSAVFQDTEATTAAYRLLLTDALPWTSTLRLNQEAGLSPMQPTPMCVHAVTWSYRQRRALMVTYDRFEVGDPVAASARDWHTSVHATCAPLTSQFSDEPPTSRKAEVCRYATGSSAFRLQVDEATPPLRLARIFDAGTGTAGVIAGSPAATIIVNGTVAGSFPAAMANPARRWQRQEAPLALTTLTGELHLTIVPDFPTTATTFSESAWELRGGWIDPVFADGFDDGFPP